MNKIYIFSLIFFVIFVFGYEAIAAQNGSELNVSIDIDAISSHSIIPGTSNMEIGRYVLSNYSNDTDIWVNSMYVKRLDQGGCYMQDLRLYDQDTGAQISDTVSSLDASCGAMFDTDQLLVKKLTSVKIKLRADIPESADIGDSFSFKIAGISVNSYDIQFSGIPTEGSIENIIEGSSITITSPNGGEFVEKNSFHTIKWESTTNISNVDIFIQKKSLGSGGTAYIAKDIANTGSYVWDTRKLIVPSYSALNYLRTASDYTMHVKSTHNSSRNDKSDSYFSVVDATCLANGTLMRTANDYRVYEMVNCQKKWIKTAEEFVNQGYDWGDVRLMSQAVVDSYPDFVVSSEDISTKFVTSAGSNNFYELINNDSKKILIPGEDALFQLGGDWSDVSTVSLSSLRNIPRAKLLKSTYSPMVFYITNTGLKRHIPTVEIFNSYGNKWEDIVELNSEYIDMYEFNDLIKLEGDYKVYKLIGGIKYWIESAEVFNQLKLDWDEIASVNYAEFNYYENGGTLTNETADWQTYRNDEYGFEVRYPNAFQKKENNQTNKLFSATDGHFWIFIDDNNQYLDAIKIKDNNKGDLGYSYQESFVLVGGINSFKQGRYDLGVIEKYYIPKGNKIFRIEFEFNFDYPDQILEEDKKELINQILPTFKFTK
jgi:hypothetical protein